MPVVITGDMTAEEVDEAMIEDLRQQVASGNPDGTTTLNISYAQAQRILELLDQGGAGKSGKSKAAPQARAAAVDEDDEDDDKPKPKTRR
jgi:hypothetical protein